MDFGLHDEPMFPYNPELDFRSLFNYDDHLRTSPLLRAVLDNNTEFITTEIENERDFNVPNNYGNTPLHAAAVQTCLETLNLILEIPGINLNCKNDLGYTPLLLSLKKSQPDSFIMRLLAAGCDVNISSNLEETPLHLAVARSSICIAHWLINHGADINAADASRCTPLHQAVQVDMVHQVCLLLSYGADVNLTCFHNLTPFMYAVHGDKLEIARMLFYHYSDFSTKSDDGYTALLLAANSRSPIAVDLVEAGVDVNVITPTGESSLTFAIYYKNWDLFKLIWPKFNKKNLLQGNPPFLFSYVNVTCFPPNQWLECLYVILNSAVGSELIVQCSDALMSTETKSLFKSLLYSFYKLRIPVRDRLAIIEILLSRGAMVRISDINILYELFGPNLELRLFIQCSTVNDMHLQFSDYAFPLSTFIFLLEDDDSPDYVILLFENQIARCSRAGQGRRYHAMRNTILRALQYFSFPPYTRLKFNSAHVWRNVGSGVGEKLSSIPTFPSLVELSRNRIRKHIKKTCGIWHPSVFYDLVNTLPIPDLFKNIILFRRPIY